MTQTPQRKYLKDICVASASLSNQILLIQQEWKILRAFFFCLLSDVLFLNTVTMLKSPFFQKLAVPSMLQYCSIEVNEAKPNIIFAIIFLPFHFFPPGPSLEQFVFVFFRKCSLSKSPLKQNKLPGRLKGTNNMVMIGCNECCGC